MPVFQVSIIAYLCILCFPLFNISICNAKNGIKSAIKKDFEKAAKAFEKDIENYPNDIFYKDAKVIIEQVNNKKIDKETTSVFFSAMSYIRKENDYRKALKIIKPAIHSNINSPELHYYLGKCYLRLNLHDKAINSFKKAIELNGDMNRAYYNMAVSYHFLNQMNTALKNYLKAAKLNYKSYSLYLNIGKIYEASGNLDTACENYITASTLLTEDFNKLEKEISAFRKKLKIARIERNSILLKGKWIKTSINDHNRSTLNFIEGKSEINHIIGNAYYKKKSYKIAIKRIKAAIGIDIELLDKYINMEDGFPYRKIEKLEYQFNNGIDILINYYKNKKDDYNEKIYTVMKSDINARIDETKVK